MSNANLSVPSTSVIYQMVFFGLMVHVLPLTAAAQLLTPNVTITGPRSAATVATTSEASINLSFESARMTAAVVRVVDLHYPKDSLHAADAARAQAWLATFAHAPVVGLHRDAYGRIAVIAG